VCLLSTPQKWGAALKDKDLGLMVSFLRERSELRRETFRILLWKDIWGW